LDHNAESVSTLWENEEAETGSRNGFRNRKRHSKSFGIHGMKGICFMASRRISTESWIGRRQAAGELARRDRVAIANSTSRISELRGDIDGAFIAFAEARRLEPNDIAALRKICRILFESQRWREAANALQELSRGVSDDASVFCNLGVARREVGDSELAIQAFEHSLILRPESVETWEQLAAILLECGRESEAAICLDQASRYRPSLSEEIDRIVSTLKTTF